MKTIKFKLTNLNCSACGKVSQMKISKIVGITSVRLDQNGQEAQGEIHAEREISIGEIQQALAGTGYKAHLI